MVIGHYIAVRGNDEPGAQRMALLLGLVLLKIMEKLFERGTGRKTESGRQATGLTLHNLRGTDIHHGIGLRFSQIGEAIGHSIGLNRKSE